MPPTKPTNPVDALTTPRKSRDPKELLANIKSKIESTKAKISALRPNKSSKIKKTTTAKEDLIRSKHLKQVLQRLSTDEKAAEMELRSRTKEYDERDGLSTIEEVAEMRTTSHNNDLSEREYLKQVLDRLSTIEETGEPNTSTPLPTDEAPSDLKNANSTEQRMSSMLPDTGASNLSIQDFELSRPLGRGQFGQVFLARHRSTDYICAIKVITKARCVSEEDERLIRRELEVHQNLAHPHILRFLSWFHDATRIFLVLEYAPGGNLYTRLKKQPKGRFFERDTAQYVAQMAEALRYMHGKNIMHRDIKPENILLGLHNEIKLADFGYSVHSESGFRSTLCGTLDYLSPEVAMMMLKPGKGNKFYTKAIDQWSLGVLTYELLVGRPPFEMKDRKATEKKIANFKGKVSFPSHVSQGARDFIRELLNLDAEKRMSLEDVLKHEWINRHLGRSVQSGLRSFNRMLELVDVE